MAENEKNKKSDAALREERVLEFWRENKIFEKSLEKKSPKGEFIFYDGPVTANSKPVLHTMVPFSFKDVIPRYRTMRGFHVRRKGGWDTHGLPIELQIEKKLGFKSKNDIENYGIAEFNKLCKESVWEYIGLWKSFTERMGYWADQVNPYVTYHNNYIESVWNVVKKVNDRNLLYKDYKVVPWCPRCGTVLSSHELAQGYEDVKDLSVYVKFRLKAVPSEIEGKSSSTNSGRENISTYFLAWTTTPWTLPGNVALAVGADIDYVKIKLGEEIIVLAKERLSVITEPYEIVTEHKGKDMVGMQYEPLFPFLKDTISGSEKSKLEKAYKVYGADFVNTNDGTGIVHTAVMYGQDDFELGTKIGLPKHHLVNPEGNFIKNTGFLEGRFVKEVNVDGKPTLAVDIIEDLKKRNLFFKQENYKHSYPHCWRCKTALIYYARDSWYIKMSDPKIKGELISQNKDINWKPAHIRDGRFGEWLKDIKDWAISRERYWGTPLPVWVCQSCKKIDVVGSIEELQNKTKKSGNKYFIMRHGEAIDNAKHIRDPKGDPNNHLTEKGKKEAISSSRELKQKNISLIITSPFLRTRETAEIVRQDLGLENEMLMVDERLHEFNESDLDIVHKRIGQFIFETETNHSGENILIISHGSPLWALEKLSVWHKSDNFTEAEMLDTAEVREIDFIALPHNENYELDLHRPYIDEISLVCTHSTNSGQVCGGDLVRAKEVMDVWFDSGAMPFAQDHYPFQNKKWVDGAGYPADYISEAIDQTRGWFYTLHAVGALMGRGKAYKNVICLGHLLDANAKKMSKSLGNVVDPWLMMEKYGVDTLRLWMYSINQPGESKNFDEKTVALLHQQVFGLLYNVLAFYELYRAKNLEKDYLAPACAGKPSLLSLLKRGVGERSNILDKWILARLDELIKIATKNLDNYKLLEPTRAIRDFIGDLSTWYLRRSRERIKDGDKEAKSALYYVLKTLAKLMAPFAPFAAEDIWLKLRNENDVESVHLTEWPKMSKMPFDIFGRGKSKVLKDMQITRDICTVGNAERQKLGIPVRQPLARLKSKESGKLLSEYLDLIKDELNVKEIIFDNSIRGEVELDINITEDLKQEGNYRELARALQDMRKKLGLTPSDIVSLAFETNDIGKKLIQKFETDMKKTVLVSKIEFENNNGDEVKIDELVFKVKIEK